ncbi:hypothetical protein CERZMDRAFT_89270 [Cercospora zeae-maydis SCOH1-5]|uniref:Uncharacterized protein n=1 Tax=Cercospora zeae-maydis SCOH1-5 TaxID=717836 RepID=A0A6A6EYF6_9PEZI|nr:hypothetical protein CERZMDRAFT_89270 [Cercospora zeae-maydis SCOH1-5]
MASLPSWIVTSSLWHNTSFSAPLSLHSASSLAAAGLFPTSSRFTTWSSSIYSSASVISPASPAAASSTHSLGETSLTSRRRQGSDDLSLTTLKSTSRSSHASSGTTGAALSSSYSLSVPASSSIESTSAGSSLLTAATDSYTVHSWRLPSGSPSTVSPTHTPSEPSLPSASSSSGSSTLTTSESSIPSPSSDRSSGSGGATSLSSPRLSSSTSLHGPFESGSLSRSASGPSANADPTEETPSISKSTATSLHPASSGSPSATAPSSSISNSSNPSLGTAATSSTTGVSSRTSNWPFPSDPPLASSQTSFLSRSSSVLPGTSNTNSSRATSSTLKVPSGSSISASPSSVSLDVTSSIASAVNSNTSVQSTTASRTTVASSASSTIFSPSSISGDGTSLPTPLGHSNSSSQPTASGRSTSDSMPPSSTSSTLSIAINGTASTTLSSTNSLGVISPTSGSSKATSPGSSMASPSFAGPSNGTASSFSSRSTSTPEPLGTSSGSPFPSATSTRSNSPDASTTMSGPGLPSPVSASATKAPTMPPPPTQSTVPGMSTPSSSSDDRFFVWNSTSFTYTGTTSFPPPTITGTMTITPRPLSTEVIASLSKNQWLTTVKVGKHTVVPVIWCKKCGGGVIIWNLWPVPTNIQIDFHVQFPNLPVFRIDCFKIFGIRIWGDCSDPKSEDDNHENGPDEDENDPTPGPPKPTNGPQSTRQSTSKEEPSSESSCTFSMATNIAVTCSPTVTGSRTIFSCSTSMSAFSGCTVTGTATTTTHSVMPSPRHILPICDAGAACNGDCGLPMPQHEKRVLSDPTNFDLFMAKSWSRAATKVVHRVEGGATWPGVQKRSVLPLHKRWTWPYPFDENRRHPEDTRVWQLDREKEIAAGRPVAPRGVSSAGWVRFGEDYTDIAVQGLWGCTSIIVVSKRGAWMSHLYETSMALERYWSDINPGIFNGDGPNLPGLNQLSQPGAIFDRATVAADDIKVFIMTPDDAPRRRGVEAAWWGDGRVQRPQPVAELERLMRGYFGVMPTVYPYWRLTPSMRTNSDTGDTSPNDLKGIFATTSAGRYYLEYDPKAKEYDSDSESDDECKQYKVGLRLWADSYKNSAQHGKPLYEAFWDPLEGQVSPPSDDDMDDSDSDTMAFYANKAGKNSSACAPKQDRGYCSAQQCGTSCVLKSSPSKTAIITRTLSSIHSWISGSFNSLRTRRLWQNGAKSPEDYATYAEFMVQESRAATMSLDQLVAVMGDVQLGIASSKAISFESAKAFNFAMSGMYGCTSIVVASRRGFWISHLWEHRSFTDEKLFQLEILGQMWTGRDQDYVGLNQFIQPGGMLDPNAVIGLQILLIVPRARVRTIEDFNAGIWPLDLEPEHAEKWDRVISSLRGVWPNAHLNKIGYVPIRRNSQIWSTQLQKYVKSPIDFQYQAQVFRTTEFGKVLIQYDPQMVEKNDHCQRDFAGYKVWTDTGYPVLLDHWGKNLDDVPGLLLRRNESCSVPPVSTRTTSATVHAPPASFSITLSYTSGFTSRTYPNASNSSASATRSPSSSSSNVSVDNTSFTVKSTTASTTTLRSSVSMSTSRRGTTSIPKFSFAPSTKTMKPAPSRASPATTAAPKSIHCEILRLGSPSTYCRCENSLLVPVKTRTDDDGNITYDCPLPSITVSSVSKYSATWFFGQDYFTTGAWGISVPVRRSCARGMWGGTVVTRKVGEMERTYDCIVLDHTMTSIGRSPPKPKAV